MMGIKGKNLGWIKNWLTEHRQRVRINSSLSSWNNVQSGFAQGSIQGPLLFIIYIWDLYIDNLMCPESITKILKYVDDTKVIGKIGNDEDFYNYQIMLDDVYKWQKQNNMMWNASKFVRLCMGPSEDIKENLLFTPDYQNFIEPSSKAKDLGIFKDNDSRFSSQCKKAITKTNQKCGWILQTFYTREIEHMRTLWITLARPHQDYGAQL